LVFSKIFPPISVWEEKEGQHFAQQLRVGKRVVNAIVREF
jgi:molybdopterin-containing oxidoreductase family membrane subunit